MVRLSLAEQEYFAQALLEPVPTVPAMERAFSRRSDGRLGRSSGVQGTGAWRCFACGCTYTTRAARSEFGAGALAVAAKDESAATFYRHHGFVSLPDQSLRSSCLWRPCCLPVGLHLGR